jgi:DNA-binding beta-propeller fold protein YncE
MEERLQRRTGNGVWAAQGRGPVDLEPGANAPPPCLRIAFAAFLAAIALAGSSTHALAGGPLDLRLVLWGFTQGSSFSQPRGVAFDPGDGALYVANTGAHRIEVFSRTGRPLSRFVHRVTRPDGTVADGEPCALAFDRSGRLLVADKLATFVDVLDRRGRYVARLDIASGHPSALAVGSDGTIYVGTTAEAAKIYRFRANYTADGSWGEQGTAPGSLYDVAALWTMGDSTIVVACERTDLAVQTFTTTGVYRHGFGLHDVGDGNFSLPAGLVVTADGRIWVADEIRRTLQVFDKEGNFVAKVSGSGTALGEFEHPSALTSDRAGLIAVTDRGIGRVQVFGIVDEKEGARDRRY